MSDIVPKKSGTENLPHDGQVGLGTWWWVTGKNDDGGSEWLGCVSHVGSNYAGITSVGGGQVRIHFDEWWTNCRPEPDPSPYLASKVAHHQGRVNELMNEVQRVTAQLGMTPRAKLGEGEASTQALAVVSGTADVQAHKQALILAKEKTLPDLFKAIKTEHAALARWMKAPLGPQKAQLSVLEASIGKIDDRIFTVELYAGLTENLVLVRDGAPADNDEKVRLFQRMHYMDEECLLAYEAGGMDFKSIRDFDVWLVKPKNCDRILPGPRCVVAFRVRRHEKWRDYEHASLSQAIRFWEEAKADKWTFLYVRNGEQVYRMDTAIEFGEKLFPDQAHHSLLAGGDLWIKFWRGSSDHFEGVASQREKDDADREHRKARREYKKEKRAWKALSKAERDKRHWGPSKPDRPNSFVPCDRTSVYFDDAMMLVAKAATDHNRIAVILQGLLDRSPAFHPHPPWQIWTSVGFLAAVELSYDDSRGLTSGPPPDFETFRAKLNATRADYLKWAPLLLVAEDYVAGKIKKDAEEDE